MRPPEIIDDPADPRAAAYLQVRERDLVGRQGRFIAEGEVVLSVLLGRSRFEPESILVAERRAASLAPLLATRPPDVPVYVASQAVIDAIAGFPLHRGILAVGLRGQEPTPQGLLADLSTDAVVVAALGISNHDNVGGIFRNAAAFGAAAVLLDEASCDPLYRKAIRVSVGGCLVTPFARGGSGLEFLDILHEEGFSCLALSPRGKEAISEVRPAGRTALILGAEGPGLPGAILARARTVRVPMAGGFDSLNVATTSGIVLHHLLAAGLQRTSQVTPSGG